MHRWRNPPIFAFAYISPARSSKRLISIIFASVSRDRVFAGSSWSCLPRAPFEPALRLVVEARLAIGWMTLAG
jgi:hypothetical protein